MVAYSDDEGEVLHAYAYNWGTGNKDTGNLGGDVRAFADDVRRLVPDLQKMLDVQGPD